MFVICMCFTLSYFVCFSEKKFKMYSLSYTEHCAAYTVYFKFIMSNLILFEVWFNTANQKLDCDTD